MQRCVVCSYAHVRLAADVFGLKYFDEASGTGAEIKQGDRVMVSGRTAGTCNTARNLA